MVIKAALWVDNVLFFWGVGGDQTDWRVRDVILAMQMAEERYDMIYRIHG